MVVVVFPTRGVMVVVVFPTRVMIVVFAPKGG